MTYDCNDCDHLDYSHSKCGWFCGLEPRLTVKTRLVIRPIANTERVAVTPVGCPLVMAEVNRAAEERIAREGIEPGIIHRPMDGEDAEKSA